MWRQTTSQHTVKLFAMFDVSNVLTVNSYGSMPRFPNSCIDYSATTEHSMPTSVTGSTFC